MYDTHFGLTGLPFRLTPDPDFWFASATHRRAMAYLGYGLAQGEGFIVVTGEVGAGKTTLVGHLLASLDPARVSALTMVSSAIEPDDLLRTVAAGLKLETAGASKADLLAGIEHALAAIARTGRRTLLVVDEAQALPIAALEELRMLSNFTANGRALLQILLTGQPEFRDRLQGSDRLEQLRQRVIAVHHLDPMGADEIAAYLAHRLSHVGWQGRPDFAEDAIPAVFALTDGVPRRINQLAHRLLLQAALEGRDLIDAEVVATVADDAAADLGPSAEPPPADDRLAALEVRIAEQDVALRRVLTLLIDWVEAGEGRAARRQAA